MEDVSKPKPLARANEWGLTEKMEAYARGVANGETLADAYRKAYVADNMSTATVYTEASKLMDHPAVAARVRMLMEERAKRTHAIDAMRVRRHVFDRLMMESVDDESPPAARIRALELLGKVDVVGMFREIKPGEGKDNLPQDAGELEARLRGMLEKMFGVAPKAGDIKGRTDR